MAKQLIEKHNIRHVDPIVAIQIGSLLVKVFRGIAHVTEGLFVISAYGHYDDK